MLKSVINILEKKQKLSVEEMVKSTSIVETMGTV